MLKRILAAFFLVDVLVFSWLLHNGWAEQNYRLLVLLVGGQVMSLPALIVGYGVWYATANDRELLRFARANQLAVVAASDHQDWSCWVTLDVFRTRSAEVVGNLLRSNRGTQEVAIFNCHYQGTRKPLRRSLTAIGIRSPQLDLPLFGLHPHTSDDERLRLAEDRDIDARTLDSHVLSCDGARKDQVLSPPLIALLQQHPDLFIEGADDGFIVYRVGGCLSADGIRSLWAAARAIVGQLEASSQPRAVLTT